MNAAELNKIATYAAIGLASFAVVYILRKPGAGPVASQTAQQQRDAALTDWTALLNQQRVTFGGAVNLYGSTGAGRLGSGLALGL